MGIHTEGGEFGTIYPILVQKMAGIPVDLYISLLSAVLVAWMAAVGFDLYRNRKGMKMGKKEMTFVIQEVMEVKKTADKLQFRKC